jgi:hypothetical protein
MVCLVGLVIALCSQRPKHIKAAFNKKKNLQASAQQQIKGQTNKLKTKIVIKDHK